MSDQRRKNEETPRGAGRRWSPEILTYHISPGGNRAVLACPVTGMLREVQGITFRDGGALTFPLEFGAALSAEDAQKAAPQCTACALQDPGQ